MIAFNQLCWIWIAIALVLFPVLLRVSQPYGKHTKKTWGPLINNNLGWFIMELPALIVFLYFLFSNPELENKVIYIAGSLWALHYVNRAIIFPLRIRTKGKKIPIVIVVFAILFNTVNGFLNGYGLAHFSTNIELNNVTSLRFILGSCIFIIGFIINQYHDHLLIKLRRIGSGYKIPYGGLFRFVSCPNFLGEIISWLGFLIVAFNLPALSFLVWTMVNLIPRALDHHSWYNKEFRDYPKERKAIFPYLL